MPAAHIPAVSPADELQVFTKLEVMARLKCSERHVDRLIDAGELKPIGRRARGVTVRITARSLREYIYGGAA
ncbi:helix-turn-helix domain-containing protein [Gordonia amicalis]|uniref:helix-turn-helix domain-containing protein n=1 Tax=Gordonia amicalis TaxID=89053 RepID=UPI0029532FEC|nr:helix-turn-helix domain-containing protein [Gordonia amicalis]MDV7171930.1 helix-turn-helix domain-containing protein [Gordonia amicalis]